MSLDLERSVRGPNLYDLMLVCLVSIILFDMHGKYTVVILCPKNPDMS